MHLFFWFYLFLEARAEILKKNLVETMTPKGHFEIKWPLQFLFFFPILFALEWLKAFLLAPSTYIKWIMQSGYSILKLSDVQYFIFQSNWIEIFLIVSLPYFLFILGLVKLLHHLLQRNKNQKLKTTEKTLTRPKILTRPALMRQPLELPRKLRLESISRL